MVTFSVPFDCDDSLTDFSDTDTGLRHSSSDSSAQGSNNNNNNSNNNNTTSGAGTKDDAEQIDKAHCRTSTRYGLSLGSSTADEGRSSLESFSFSFSSQQGANNNNNNSPYGLSSSYNPNDRESLESNSSGTTYTYVEEASSATSSPSSLSQHDPNRTPTNHNDLFSPVAWAPDPNMFGGNNNNNNNKNNDNDNDNNNENENGNDESNNNNNNINNVHPDALASGNDVEEEDRVRLLGGASSLEEPFHFECLNEPCWSSSITISTTMRSFLPNKPFINATAMSASDLVPRVMLLVSDLERENDELKSQLKEQEDKQLLVQITGPNGTPIHYEGSLKKNGHSYRQSYWRFYFVDINNDLILLNIPPSVFRDLEIWLGGIFIENFKDFERLNQGIQTINSRFVRDDGFARDDSDGNGSGMGMGKFYLDLLLDR